MRSFILIPIMLSTSMTAVALPAVASADQPACTPDQSKAKLEAFSRPLVPVGVRAARGFQVQDFQASNLALSAAPDYSPAPFATKLGSGTSLGLYMTAPHPGPFTVQGTWTQGYYDSNGAPQSCIATGATTLTATNGTPLKFKPPKSSRFAGKTPRYRDLAWTWKCDANTDPTPIQATVRYEVKTRGKLSRKAKKFSAVAQDPCDGHQAVQIDHKIPQRTKLRLLVGGDVSLSQGQVRLDIIFPYGHYHFNGLSAVHLGVEIKQGARTLASKRYCGDQARDFFKETRDCRPPN